MKQSLLKLSVFCCLWAAVVTAGASIAQVPSEAAAGDANRVEVGQSAPDFSLPDLSGTVHSLSESRAQGPIIMIFFRGAW